METFLPNGKYILTQQKFNELKANNQLIVGAEYEIITDDLDSKWYYVAPSLESITPPPAELMRSLILTPTETPSVFDMSTWNETEEEWVTFGTTTLSGEVIPINDWEEATNQNIPSALLVKNEFEAFDELKLDDKLRETRTTQIIKDTNNHVAVGVKIDNGSLWTVDYEKPSTFEIPSTRYGITQIGNKLYFVGGFTSMNEYVYDSPLDRKPFNKILSFDVVTKKWAVEYEFDSYYYAFANNMVVAVGNDIYVMGAMKYIRYGTNQATLPFIPFKYNIVSKTVTYLTANSGLNVSNGAVYYNDKIYMPYGYYDTITGRSYIETTETIFENSPLQHEIENATLPTNASEMQSLYDIANFDVATQDGIVVKVYNNSSAVYFRVGYTTINESYSNDLNIYTVSTGVWSTGATPPVLNDSRRHQGSSILVNGVIYVKRSSFFASYNIETATWTTLAEPYIGSVHGENPQFHDGYIYYAGGWVGYATTSTPEYQYNSSLITRYKIADNTWEAHSLLPQLNNHEQGYGCLYLIGDDLYYLSGYSNEYDGYPYTNPYVYKYDLTQGPTYDKNYYNGLVIENGMLKVPHDDTKLNRFTTQGSLPKAYVQYVDGTESFFYVGVGANHDAIARRKDNGLLRILMGNTASRPTTNLNAGDLYFNTELECLQVYDGNTWVNLNPNDYIPKTAIKNNLTETAEGGVLDARQGKILNDGKLDKSTSTSGLIVYTRNNTTDGFRGLTTIPAPNLVPLFKSNGLLRTLSGNKASRPSTDLHTGDQYFNTDTNQMEIYIGDANHWLNQVYGNGDTLPTPAVGTSHTYLVVGNGVADDDGNRLLYFVDLVNGNVDIYDSGDATLNGSIITISNVGGTIIVHNSSDDYKITTSLVIGDLNNTLALKRIA
jgi:hypothetical protein